MIERAPTEMSALDKTFPMKIVEAAIFTEPETSQNTFAPLDTNPEGSLITLMTNVVDVVSVESIWNMKTAPKFSFAFNVRDSSANRTTGRVNR
jgi:hypothetical protein